MSYEPIDYQLATHYGISVREAYRLGTKRLEALSTEEIGALSLKHKVRLKRDYYATKFRLTEKMIKKLDVKFLDQLDGCFSDCERRLILGGTQ